MYSLELLITITVFLAVAGCSPSFCEDSKHAEVREAHAGAHVVPALGKQTSVVWASARRIELSSKENLRWSDDLTCGDQQLV